MIMIDRKTEEDLVRRAQAGDALATVELIEAHEPMLRKLVKRHGRHLAEDDGMSCAMLGFIEGLPRFDPDAGFRLNTFIRHYAAEGVRNANRRAPMVRLTQSADLNTGMRIVADMIRRNEPVSPASLAARAGYSTDLARTIIAKHAHSGPGVYMSINEALDVEDDRHRHPDEIIEMSQRRALLEKAKTVLNERERFVFDNRVGSRQDMKTLAEISEIYGVSRERIRQIEVKALAKVQRQLSRLGLPRVDLSLKAA